MALIKCTECGQMVSDKASACPHCGCPVGEMAKDVAPEGTEQQADVNKEQDAKPANGKQHRKTWMIAAVVVLVLLIGAAICCIPSSPKDYSSEPIEVVIKEANEGNADAQNYLGTCYFKGDGVKQNYKKAVVWFHKAAVQGHADAQNSLGVSYACGLGVKEDKAKGIKWVRKAAEQGHTLAQANLGCFYCDGIGVERDYFKASEWIMKSAESGDSVGQYILGCYYYYGNACVRKDSVEGVKWLRKSAKQGFGDAKEMLKEMGVEQ